MLIYFYVSPQTYMQGYIKCTLSSVRALIVFFCNTNVAFYGSRLANLCHREASSALSEAGIHEM